MPLSLCYCRRLLFFVVSFFPLFTFWSLSHISLKSAIWLRLLFLLETQSFSLPLAPSHFLHCASLSFCTVREILCGHPLELKKRAFLHRLGFGTSPAPFASPARGVLVLLPTSGSRLGVLAFLPPSVPVWGIGIVALSVPAPPIAPIPRGRADSGRLECRGEQRCGAGRSGRCGGHRPAAPRAPTWGRPRSRRGRTRPGGVAADAPRR